MNNWNRSAESNRFFVVDDSPFGPIFDFIKSVDWSEPFLRVLLAAEALFLAVSLLTLHNAKIQSTLFFSALFILAMSESINTWAANHWQSFSATNYFDENGAFIGAVFAAPLLLITFVLLINLVRLLGNLMVQVKTLQLKKELKDRAKRTKSD